MANAFASICCCCILHDNVPTRGDDEAQELCRELIKWLTQRQSCPCSTAIATYLNGTRLAHLHAVHDCSWSYEACRYVAFYEINRRLNRSSIRSCSTTTSIISSRILLRSADQWNTLTWQELTGPSTLELKFCNDQDVSSQEMWKLSSERCRVQMHATNALEV